jgi:3-mercaptopyruvate sulfurtransferase SseA
MGGIIGALVVGLVLVVFLLMNNQNPGVTSPTNSGSVSNALPTSNVATNASPEPTVELAPRMPFEEFKALYDDPAKRPLIVDVRAAEAYAQGHIAGAVNIPEAAVQDRLAEFPKDKLVIAYCQ